MNKYRSVLIVVLDGVGWEPQRTQGNALLKAHIPCLNRLMASSLSTTLLAHGKAVGMPSNSDMGNSEVGHNVIGAGRIFSQGALLVNQAIDSGSLFSRSTWQKIVHRPELISGSQCLHIGGLLSDGNVHSHQNHLFALLKEAKKIGIKKIRLHMLLDGRDVSPKSALIYAETLESVLNDLKGPGIDYKIASGGGRSSVTMDRYGADWPMVQRGYQAHVLGQGPAFSSLKAAIEHFYSQGIEQDQQISEFVMGDYAKEGVQDGDSFIFFNFRGDRAIEFTQALTQKDFPHFVRTRVPKVLYAGMMQYDGDLKIPENYLVSPPVIEDTLSSLLSEKGITQFACSETQKFGHVTYFWNGNHSQSLDKETWIEIPSDDHPFQDRPWMKCAEICDATLKFMTTTKEPFVARINFANGDMVGHTGNLDATITALDCMDLQLQRILMTAEKTNTTVIVTADHGNADHMWELDSKGMPVLNKQNIPIQKTSHSLSPVPFIVYNPKAPMQIVNSSGSLGNIASTTLEIFGLNPPSFYLPSLVKYV